MTLDIAVWVLLVTAIVLANIPWIFSNRVFVILPLATKNIWVNFAEWILYFMLTGLLAYLLESKAMGVVKEQEWEFYAVAIFMFAIFSFPGFIYRYNLKAFLDKAKNQT
ncbi:MAG: DUF2818 domain-containing protein [Piscirickettsiaceae bacterium CG_4_9_14_3_um_filter_43_564]|nr:DUF2818 family protein [Thiomicrospira sp.]OIP94662.1 MAG: hypothetical protein AUK56_08615 [Thiomicrospira sp. CG2_30_44_34]PIQ03507.1 MAG: hypothetical protein COW74_06865 [Piscirickettsiaceae bacterium CG18_big_fil_WC_8_21_14_2_50_44_103]PIU38027.1 MAG: DUF2818 domain-containing protein [Piscirickettsiaceae bacterium CG07_land_8_20_14_0_80_44_28]PIW56600.1 MAG: DUF2818 domain-containing protein [Piscirickettsiaceae bacterium CG12_big_fil_rev_8_21_14_0_65_44_934]PIW77211.1 MAG: DUF2818 do